MQGRILSPDLEFFIGCPCTISVVGVAQRDRSLYIRRHTSKIVMILLKDYEDIHAKAWVLIFLRKKCHVLITTTSSILPQLSCFLKWNQRATHLPTVACLPTKSNIFQLHKLRPYYIHIISLSFHFSKYFINIILQGKYIRLTKNKERFIIYVYTLDNMNQSSVVTDHDKASKLQNFALLVIGVTPHSIS